MSTALLDSSNPQGQTAALQFYQTIEGHYANPMVAKSHMTDDAKPIYDAIQNQVNLNRDPQALPQIIQNVDQNLDALKDVHKIEWKQITGDAQENAAVANVTGALQKALNGSGPLNREVVGLFHTGAFSNTGEAPSIDPATTLPALMNTLKQAAIIQSGNGKVDIQALADQTINNAWGSGRLELLPTEGGGSQIRIKQFGDFDSVTGKPLLTLSPAARNPATGQTEDTLATFRNDMSTLSASSPGLMPDTKAISVEPLAPRGVNGMQPQGADGVYWLKRSGARMTIGLGEDIAMHGDTPALTPDAAEAAAVTGQVPAAKTTPFTVPADPKEAAAALSDAFKGTPGLVLVPNDPVAPTAFWVGYRPHLTGTAPAAPTDAEMRAKRQPAQWQSEHPEAPYVP